MLELGDVVGRNCEGLSRRRLLQVGAASLIGLALPDALRAREARASEREKSVIFLWLDGGPSHFETFDPKPDAPADIRGPYQAIDTNVSGIRISELLPMLAQQAHCYALIRSFTHGIDSHSPIPVLTAGPRSTTSHGAVVTYLKGHTGTMPPYVHLGTRLGVGGGNLGPAFNPVEVPDPTGSNVQLPDFAPPADVNPGRFNRRRRLLAQIDEWRRQIDAGGPERQRDAYYQRAMAMLSSGEVRQAFDLTREPEPLRDRYGANFFGQSCLLARRLVEAGSRFVQVKWYDGIAFHGWDVHGADLAGLVRMEQHLCPRFDQGLSALLDDLHRRGLLDTTLVCVAGEFGRTPKINNLGGRDHWPHCFSVLMAGGGVPGGTVIGSSDHQGAYPADRPVRPPDFAATIYRLLGMNPNLDDRVRPFTQGGEPVAEITGTA